MVSNCGSKAAKIVCLAVEQEEKGILLQRALQHKVERVCSLLIAEEEIKVELERVVCRLTSLALCRARRQLAEPSVRRLQCQLYDLLVLSEKSMERRKQYFIDSYRLPCEEYDSDRSEHSDATHIWNFKEDNVTANELLDKYNHLLHSSTEIYASDAEYVYRGGESQQQSDYQITAPSKQCFEDYGISLLNSNLSLMEFQQSVIDLDKTISNESIKDTAAECELQVSNDVPYDIDIVSNKCYLGKCKKDIFNIFGRDGFRNSKTIKKKKHKVFRKVQSTQKTNVIKKVVSENVISDISVYKCSRLNFTNKNKKEDHHFSIISKKIWVINEKHEPTVAKPIPDGLIQLCKISEKLFYKANTTMSGATQHCDKVAQIFQSGLATTEDSYLIDIVMEDFEETIALRRTTGTDMNDAEIYFSKARNVEMEDDKTYMIGIATKPSQLQAIFLFDINEPSTSKGIRHSNLDEKCGSDTVLNIEAANGSTINISSHVSNIKASDKCLDFGTCTKYDNEGLICITPNIPAKGIRIKDSTDDFNFISNIMNFDVKNKVEDRPILLTSPISKTLMASNTETQTISLPIPIQVNIKDIKTDSVLNPCREFVPCTNTMNDGCQSISKTLLVIKESASNTRECSDIFNNTYDKESRLLVTKLFKPVTSCMKIEESSSELSGSINSSTNNPFNFDHSSINVVVENISTLLRRNRPQLTRGTVQMHSFREKLTSEDVVYQGRWQSSALKSRITANIIKTDPKINKLNDKCKYNYRGKISRRKSVHILEPQNKNMKLKTERRTIIESKTNQTSVIYKNSIKTNRSTHKLPRTNTSTLPAKTKQANIQKGHKTPSIKNFITINKHLSRTRVCLKAAIGSATSHNKQDITCKDNNDSLKFNYSKKIKNNVNVNLLKPEGEHLNNNINYFIFRNECDNNESDDSKSKRCASELAGKDAAYKKISCSSMSVSSSCSTVNSIATVLNVASQHNTAQNNKNSTAKVTRPQSASPMSKSFKVGSSNSLTKGKSCNRQEDIEKSKLINLGNSGQGNKQCLSNLKTSYKVQEKEDTTSSIKSSNENNKNAIISKIRNTVIPESVHSTITNGPEDNFNNKVATNNVDLFQNKDTDSEDISGVSIHINDINNYDNVMAFMTMPKIIDNVSSSIQNVNCNKSIISNYINISKDFLKRNEQNFLSEVNESSVCTKASASYTLNDMNKGENLNNSRTAPLPTDTTLNNIHISDSNSNIDMQSNVSHKTAGKDVVSNKSMLSLSLELQSSLSDETPVTFNDASSNALLHDIFERKDHLNVQRPPGMLAVQAFSGFSVNESSVAGDRPAYNINVIASEANSMNVQVSRQTASEEFYVLGRSSDSFQSCFIDDDAAIPNWLFEIIAEQNGNEEVLEVVALPQALAEPLVDVNGNPAERVAGAGDGRGVHSDHSRHSSDRTASLSSSNTNMSSGPLSEVMMVDPSSFATQYELLRNPQMPQEESSSSRCCSAFEEANSSSSNNYEDAHCLLVPLVCTSDFDADVSSMDTDGQDCSDS